ncbi:hypothetical protein [Sulfitobacter guttiformis]|uniref:Dynein-related subfamily AAA family protein n=1 Tax=Sulfitobacter guttiformis TaxID=74349 RepID=A0A420DTK5_9RHOB|nr:hypothetical protein [Sulfitobacter guttiformis]KIN71139.1 ATPase associated with various cellular activities AAA 5 [Sulfitobacter guttiformis KCTC 32187]RKE97616.1 hypothetical protein C8N30_2230 [Sulfitobacter guttiformis]
MFSASIFVFGGLCIALVVLTFITLFLATQHDKLVALAGPLEEEKAIDARIAEKRVVIIDLEEELEKRRKAMAIVADIGAEVDALTRQRDDLLTEWNQLESRKSEVAEIRLETESAMTEQLELDGELASAKATLEEVRDKLAHADKIVHRIEDLSKEQETLERRVGDLRDNLRDLEDAESRVSQLADRAQKMETELSGIEGQLVAKNAELTEVEDRLAATRSTYGDLRSEFDSLSAELAAARQRKDDLVQEQSIATDRITGLEVRKATLDREIEKARGLASGQTGEKHEDPLHELKKPPQVIERLVSWDVSEQFVESEALLTVKKRFNSFGLDYPDRILRAFHTAMKVNDTTQMAVLAGISGTGKSQLPRQYAAGMGIGFLQVPVQPRWDSPQDLMGFYNYIEGRFRPTDMARALYALDEQNNNDAVQDRMLMVLLDEMNLARVEYYFSDFLSRLESRPARGKEAEKNLRKDAEIELEIPNSPVRVFPGYNLLFAGTMNEDESTQSLSDKVVDRANVMRFGAPKKLVRVTAQGKAQAEKALSRSTWDRWCQRPLQTADRSRGEAQVDAMLALMQSFGKPFGHRLGRSIISYVAAYPELEGGGERISTALADQIEMRLLPKLRGVDVEDKSQQFDQLRKLASDYGDEPLADAIKESVDAAEATGQFVWKGVMR